MEIIKHGRTYRAPQVTACPVCECKVKINDTWVEGVIYEGIDYNTGCLMQFVRTKDDFINNFEPYGI